MTTTQKARNPRHVRMFSKLQKSVKRIGATLWPEKIEFDYWCSENANKCFYCGISTDQFLELRDCIIGRHQGDLFSNQLTKKYFSSQNFQKIQDHVISRVDKTKGYDLENIRMSCWFCHKHRGYDLDEDSMVVVGPALRASIARGLDAAH